METTQDLKNYVHERLSKIESVTLNRDIENIPSKYDVLQFDVTIKQIEKDIENIRNEQSAQKELSLIKQNEIDTFFKQTSTDYFQRLKEIEDQMTKMISDQSIESNLKKHDNKLNMLESDVIELKNAKKQSLLRNT